MRYNPPPNWPPVPQGWTPPPGWQPDPSWPPPPPGWPLWVPDTRRRTALIVGGIAAAVLAVVVVLVLALSGSSKPSDEAQIRSLVQRAVQAHNRGDAEAFGRCVCAEERVAEEKRLRNDDDIEQLDISVDTVTVNGDRAAADVTGTDKDGDTHHETLHFVREDGDWKICDDD